MARRQGRDRAHGIRLVSAVTAVRPIPGYYSLVVAPPSERLLKVNPPACSVAVATPEDAAFLREMARHAATLEDRPLPAADAEAVTELVPADVQDALVAVSATGLRLGAAWLLDGRVPLVPTLPSAPEVCMALAPDNRNRGVGTALLQAVISRAAAQGHAALVLNVHLRNTAALRLYMKCGFRVAGAGRGWFGVALARALLRV